MLKKKNLEKKYIVLIVIIIIMLILGILSYSLKKKEKLNTFETILKDGIVSIENVIFYPFRSLVNSVNDFKLLKDVKKENDILKNANPNTPVVLSTLKKEKSSKPFLVLIIFALLITTVFMFPNIKKYMATNDNAVTRFYNSYLKSFLENDNSNDYYYDFSTTTKANTDVQKTDVQCASLGDVYVYHFLNNVLNLNYYEY